MRTKKNEFFDLFLIKITDNYSDITSQKGISTYMNPYQYYILRRTELIKSIDYIFFDGYLLTLLISLFNMKKYKVLQPDLSGFFHILFKDSIIQNKTCYLIGGTPTAIRNSLTNIKKKFPELNILSYRNGYFNDANEKEQYIQNIVSSNPDFILVGMGVPKQEEFLIQLKSAGYKGSGISCGGFFHQTAKKTNYYPKLIQKLNIRWIYRIIDEPKLIYRYFIIYPISLFLFIYDLLIYKTQKLVK